MGGIREHSYIQISEVNLIVSDMYAAPQSGFQGLSDVVDTP